MQNQPINTLPSELRIKIESIIPLFQSKKIIVAFSGGIDSTLVVYLAKCYAAEVVAVIINSPMTPSIELENAKRFAQKLELSLEIVEINTLDNPEIATNRIDRCYFCKANILQQLEQLALDRRFDAVMDGTNYSDLGLVRAGLKALKESHVISPLAEAKLTKAEIINISNLLNLPSKDIPSQACLASRIPFGIPLTAELLGKIDQAENSIRKIINDYKSNIRVRVHDLSVSGEKQDQYLARIEMENIAINQLLDPQIRIQIQQSLCQIGFIYVTIDLNGFESGSLHRVL